MGEYAWVETPRGGACDISLAGRKGQWGSEDGEAAL